MTEETRPQQDEAQPAAPANRPPANRPPPDMAALMVRLAEIRREVDPPPARPRGRAWAWALGAIIGLLLAPLLFGKGACLPF